LVEPVVVPEAGGVQLQVRVTEGEEKGQWKVSLYSREESGAEGSWVENVVGVLEEGLSEAGDVSGFERLRSWPPANAQPRDLGSFYESLAERGLTYGPGFQGLVEVRREGKRIYGRVVLPPSVRDEADRYGIHPALLDAALHTLGVEAA